MRVVSHPEADQELEAAALWYEDRQPGLGDHFLDEFERTLRRILAEPERWPKIRGENRKLNFKVSSGVTTTSSYCSDACDFFNVKIRLCARFSEVKTRCIAEVINCDDQR